MSMNPRPNKNTDQEMIDEFLAKGGEVTVGKTKAMASELGISNNSWNQKLTKAERDAKAGK
jgi:DNA-binding transcriptional regulator YdaS (Cro superfamily)